ncbi:MAG: N(G),N(G)-dimethylarginine dimethylaminohydrolase [Bowdeniella nasicola]|nr:N(G),N(G)-dimethylarginine dimethylaminohydrolase [Bowdeniella nasicola]
MFRQRAFVRRPGPALTRCSLCTDPASPAALHRCGGAFDPTLALDQWESYVDALHECGWETYELPHVQGHNCCPFVESDAVAYDRLFIVTRPRQREAQSGQYSIAAAAEARGFDVLWIDDAAYLDGMDVLKFGGHMWIGLTENTDSAGANQLAAHLRAYGVRAHLVPCKPATYLKNVMTALPDGSLLVYRPLLGRLETHASVVAAPEPTGARVMLLGGNRVMMGASAPRTAEMLRRRGYDVLTVDISEFEKIGAGPTCLSIRMRADS